MRGELILFLNAVCHLSHESHDQNSLTLTLAVYEKQRGRSRVWSLESVWSGVISHESSVISHCQTPIHRSPEPPSVSHLFHCHSCSCCHVFHHHWIWSLCLCHSCSSCCHLFRSHSCSCCHFCSAWTGAWGSRQTQGAQSSTPKGSNHCGMHCLGWTDGTTFRKKQKTETCVWDEVNYETYIGLWLVPEVMKLELELWFSWWQAFPSSDSSDSCS